MGHDVYLDGSCRVYVRKLSSEVLNSCIITKIVNGEAPAVAVRVSRIAKQTLCELIMDGYKRSYVQCQSGRLAGSLIHTVISARRKSTTNKAQHLEAVVDLDVVTDESLKEVFAKKRCTVVVENPPAVQEVFDKLPKLRKRKPQNYLELSILSLADVNNRNDKHVPIYRQVNQSEKTERRKPDLYEFDSDSENTKKRKRQKVPRNSADTSLGFEKGMKDVMDAIEKNFKRNQARRRKNIKKKQETWRDKNLKAVLNDEGVELHKTQKNVSSKAIEKQVANEEVEFLSRAQHEESYVSGANAVDSNRASTSSEKGFLGFQRSDLRPAVETIENETGSQCVETKTKGKTTVNPETTAVDLFDEDTTVIESEFDLFGFNDESPPTSQTKDESANSATATTEAVDVVGFDGQSIEPLPETLTNNMRRKGGIDDLFGFNGEINESSPRSRINIISNIVVNPKLGGVNSYNDFHRPNANSTMVVIRRPKRSSSPWRPDLGITRNPYLLQFKDTLLPNYNQEMVLDSSISDRNCSKTPTRPTTTPKVHQTSILTYFSGSKGTHEITKESSLFDDSDFSPIKSVKEHVDENKENLLSPPLRTSTAIKKVKRDILGQSAAPNRMPLSPLQNFTNRSRHASQEDIEDYFGFDSITEEDKENTFVQPNKLLKSYFNKPVRFGDVVKQAVRNKVHVEEEPVRKEPLIEEESLVPDNFEQAEEDLSLRLFEDLKDKRPIRKYAPPKRVRRPRQPSFVSENSDDEIDYHKHKKRNARTKEEEKEFERWAATFNSMCHEVDEYALEIE